MQHSGLRDFLWAGRDGTDVAGEPGRRGSIIEKYRNNEGAFNFSLGSLKSKTYTKNNRVEEDREPEKGIRKRKTKKVEEFEKALATWDGWLEEQHEEEALVSFFDFLESRSRAIHQRIELLKMERRI
ncbi:hypothetical protein SLA2020_452480 [Shorea laevis]